MPLNLSSGKSRCESYVVNSIPLSPTNITPSVSFGSSFHSASFGGVFGWSYHVSFTAGRLPERAGNSYVVMFHSAVTSSLSVGPPSDETFVGYFRSSAQNATSMKWHARSPSMPSPNAQNRRQL